jgi:hypothetical protein
MSDGGDLAQADMPRWVNDPSLCRVSLPIWQRRIGGWRPRVASRSRRPAFKKGQWKKLAWNIGRLRQGTEILVLMPWL